MDNLSTVLPAPEMPGGFGPPPGMGRGFGPRIFLGPVLFAAADTSKDQRVTEEELTSAFGRWFSEWDVNQRGFLDDQSLAEGLNKSLVLAEMAQVPGEFGERRGPGRPGRGGRRAGFGPGGPGGGGPTLDPLVSAENTRTALASRLLSVPAFRERYLGYVRDIAEKWLDWNKLGPIAESYQKLIVDEVKLDTRKLSTFEAFAAGIGGEADPAEGGQPGMRRGGSLKSFTDQRRAFLLDHPQVKAAKSTARR